MDIQLFYEPSELINSILKLAYEIAKYLNSNLDNLEEAYFNKRKQMVSSCPNCFVSFNLEIILFIYRVILNIGTILHSRRCLLPEWPLAISGLNSWRLMWILLWNSSVGRFRHLLTDFYLLGLKSRKLI